MTEPEDKSERLVEELVAEVLDRYRHLLPGEALEELHDALTDLILTHPDGRALVRQMLPEPPPSATTTVARDGVLKAAEAVAVRKRASKR